MLFQPIEFCFDYLICFTSYLTTAPLQDNLRLNEDSKDSKNVPKRMLSHACDAHISYVSVYLDINGAFSSCLHQICEQKICL